VRPQPEPPPNVLPSVASAERPGTRGRQPATPGLRASQSGCSKRASAAHRGSLLFPRFTCKSTEIREPTSGLEPLSCSLRVIGQALQGCAGDCKCRIFRGVSFPCLAACCTVLRSRWYQSGINITLVATSDKKFPRVGSTTFVAMPQEPQHQSWP